MYARVIFVMGILLSQALLALSPEETAKLVASIDENQRNSGDYKSLVFIEEKERNKPTKLFEALVYRRDVDDKWIILFTKPKSEGGKGYLRVEKNIFLYEPALGKWERTTERARIGGTNSQRSDFDESRLAEEFNHQYVGLEKLGKFPVHHLKLSVKTGIDVAFPVLHLWVDQDTKNILKKQDFSLSEKLMRTIYYPKWEKMYSRSKKADVYVPKEIRIFDEVEKDNSTLVILKEVSLDPLEANIFTKAWIEKKSK
ncbi:MAG: outer membrane lipoprotein-sorting protein [Deltaproteobacteria bacterium]|nr:outer membrane lipoprotein-sorting protein [Deltaproteobacteria bacterium]